MTMNILIGNSSKILLCGVMGAGEPVFEVDFPPGSDVMGEILSVPMAVERMEFELFSRMRVH